MIQKDIENVTDRNRRTQSDIKNFLDRQTDRQTDRDPLNLKFKIKRNQIN